MALLLALCGILGAIIIFVPDLREWMASNAWWAWACVLVLLLTFSAMFAFMEHQTEQTVQADLTAKTTVERLRLELTSEREKSRDLARKMATSARDKKQFDSILLSLPWGEGIIWWLEHDSLKEWAGADTEPLYSLYHEWAEWFFDNTEVDASFSELRHSLGRLTDWMAGNAFALTAQERRERGLELSGEIVYRIPDGDDRKGGWPEYDEIRHLGRKNATAFIDERRNFERVGRAFSL